MKRTIRTLAAPAIAMLILSSCGTGATDAEAPRSTDATPVAAETPDSSAVDESGDQSMDDGGEDGAAEEGNITSVEFGGETLDLDVNALTSGTWDPEARFYAENSSGAKYIIDFDADGPEDLEAYREKTGIDPVSYVRIDIDNTNGTNDATAGNLVVVDSDGQEYDFETAFIAMDEWGPSMYDDGPADENGGYYYALADGTKIPEEEYTPLQNEGVDLYNELLDTDASPRAKQTIWLIGDEMPETMSYFGLDDGSEDLFGMPLL